MAHLKKLQGRILVNDENTKETWMKGSEAGLEIAFNLILKQIIYQAEELGIKIYETTLNSNSKKVARRPRIRKVRKNH